jgi:hypothetical protein
MKRNDCPIGEIRCDLTEYKNVYKAQSGVLNSTPPSSLLFSLLPLTPVLAMSSLEKGTAPSGGHRIVEVDQHGHVIDGNINSALPPPTVGLFSLRKHLDETDSLLRSFSTTPLPT